jgi:hypothetical protein
MERLERGDPLLDMLSFAPGTPARATSLHFAIGEVRGGQSHAASAADSLHQKGEPPLPVGGEGQKGLAGRPTV